jgi:hypothetical protein
MISGTLEELSPRELVLPPTWRIFSVSPMKQKNSSKHHLFISYIVTLRYRRLLSAGGGINCDFNCNGGGLSRLIVIRVRRCVLLTRVEGAVTGQKLAPVEQL